MEQAIKIAIENGWDYMKHPDVFFVEFGDGVEIKEKDLGHQLPLRAILLDPLFWQALGKGLGWSPNGFERKWIHQDGTLLSYQNKLPKWRWEQSMFLDHLAEGKDIESFFTSLLPTN